MKNYRNIIIFFFVALIIFSLVGCSKSNLVKFNGIPFGKTQKEVMPEIEAMLKKQGYKGDVKEYKYKDSIYNIRETFDDVELDGNKATLSLLFVMRDDTGAITDSKFFSAKYTIPVSTAYKATELFEFYGKKYTKTFGEPNSKNENEIAWGYYEDDSPFVAKGICRITSSSTNNGRIITIHQYSPAVEDSAYIK